MVISFCVGVALQTSAQPVNDRCGGAIALTLDTVYQMNTGTATSTKDPTEVCGAGFGRSVWFSLTPPQSGMVTLSTCGSDFDTAFEVYTGFCSNLIPVVCSDDLGPACPTQQASAEFLAYAGVMYRIVVGGSGGASGQLQIVASMPTPPNAFCSGAIPLTDGTPFSMDTTYALSLGDWLPVCRTNFGKAVWFSYQPPSDGPISISTCGSDFDTVLQVYTGSCDALLPLACNDDSGPGCPTNQASVSFVGSAQTNYLILAGGYAGAVGTLSISAARLAPPPNRDCASAIPMVTGVPYGGNTFDAPPPNPGLPLCVTNFGHALWYTFTPPVSGWVGISTCGSDFDTVVQVFTGNCSALVPVDGGCNDDGGPLCGSLSASVCFMGTAGTTYRVLVGGYGTNWGNLELGAGVLPPMSFTLDRNYFTVLWPTNVGDIHLDFTTNLAPPVVWTPWDYHTEGTNFAAPAYRDAVGPKAFFRLRP